MAFPRYEKMDELYKIDPHANTFLHWLESKEEYGYFDFYDAARRYHELLLKHLEDVERGKPFLIREPKRVLQDELLQEHSKKLFSKRHPSMTEDLSAVIAPAKIAVVADDRTYEYSVEPAPTNDFVKALALLTQRLTDGFPYESIYEICENFIHAYFEGVCITISKNGKQICFSDKGPGPNWNDKFQASGYSTASEAMKPFITNPGEGYSLIDKYRKSSPEKIRMAFGNTHGQGFKVFLYKS